MKCISQRPKTFLLLADTILLMMFFNIVSGQNPVSEDSSTIFLNDSATLYTKVDAQPQFPGGQAAWVRFVMKHAKYPKEAEENGYPTQSAIKFIVDVDGTINDIRTVSGDSLIAKEAARIISLSGKWKPAIYKGQKIKAYKIQSLNYEVQVE